MRQMQPVLWTKGVLLTPQHLQLQDRFLEDLLEFRLSSLTFAPWGFHRLTVDREALAAGAFAITAAVGVLPDGANAASSPMPPLRPSRWKGRSDRIKRPSPCISRSPNTGPAG